MKNHNHQKSSGNSQTIPTVIAIVLAFASIIGLLFFAQLAVRGQTENRIDFAMEQPENMPGTGDNHFSKPEDSNSFNHDSIPDNNHNAVNDFNGNTVVPGGYIVAIVIFSMILAVSIIYLATTSLDIKFWQKPAHLAIYIILNIVAAGLITLSGLMIPLFCTENKTMQHPEDTSDPRDETNFNTDNLASSNNINLSNQDSDITIAKSGTYTFTGSFTHSIVVNAEDSDVELILNNVDINNPETAAIVGLAAKKITITTVDGSKNILNDGGKSIYDGCIFSNAELVFQGNGELIVNGNQEEGEGIATEARNITFQSGTYSISSNDDGINAGGDGATITINGGTFYIDTNGDGIDSNKNAIINGGTVFVIGSDIGGDAGIDTDDGFTINGGTVIALGSDMIETPLKTSQQNTLAFTLEQKIDQDTTVAILDEQGNSIIAFSAPKSFKTIIISTPDLKSGNKYQISVNGEHTGRLVNGIYQGGAYSSGNLLTLNGLTTFTVTDTISSFGTSNRK